MYMWISPGTYCPVAALGISPRRRKHSHSILSPACDADFAAAVACLAAAACGVPSPCTVRAGTERRVSTVQCTYTSVFWGFHTLSAAAPHPRGRKGCPCPGAGAAHGM